MSAPDTQKFTNAGCTAPQARLERAYTLLTETPGSNGPITLDQLVGDSQHKGCYRPDWPKNKPELPIIQMRRFIPLPACVGELATSSCRSFMGCFPEIHRVWFTIDTKLLLWNYSSDAVEPLTELLDYNQVILNAGIVKPKPGVFLDQVEYIIAIASFFELCLFSVTFSKKKDYNSIMTIHRTEISVPTDNVIFNQIVGFKNGRLFVGGDDGRIYDIIYQAENGWLSDGIRKVDHSSSYLKMLIPSFIGGSYDEGVKALVLDERRNLLYALKGNSDIHVVYLGKNGDKYIQCKGIKKAEISAALKCGDQILRNIFVLPYQKSRMMQLVAITSVGDRVFFSLYNNEEESLKASMGLIAPTTFKVTYAHKENRQVFSILTDFKDVLFDSGLSIGVCSKNSRVDRIWCMTPSIGEISQLKSPYKSWLELYDSFEIECDVWKVFRVSNGQTSKQQPGVFGDFHSQIFEGKWTFCALTNIGLQFFDVLRPLDQLYELVSSYGDQSRDNYATFMKTYGSKETLSMFLELSSSSLSTWSMRSNESLCHQVQDAAMNTFLQHEAYIASQTQTQVGSCLNPNDPNCISRLNGLILYTFRLFDPFWATKILDQMNQILDPDNIEEILKYKRKLERLSILLEKRIIPHISNDSSTEKEYFIDIQYFLSRACEILSLLLIFKDSNYTKFEAGLPPKQRSCIRSLSFGDLVWTREGYSLIQNILTAYVKKVLSLGQHLTPVEKLLRNSCPSIYTESSKLFSRGWNKIVKASELPEDSKQRRKLLEESLKYFKDEMIDIQASQFLQIVDEYRGLLFYKGIVNVCISWARRNHSNLFLAPVTVTSDNVDVVDCLGIIHVALMSMKAEYTDKETPDAKRRELEMDKTAALKCIFSVRNKTFLFNVYSRLVKEFTDDLLRAEPPYFEDFILNLEDNSDKYMILAKHYSATNKYSKAAVSYSNLAGMPDCDLEERINYLTHSLFYWRLSTNKSIVDLHLMEDTEIRLKIAYVQHKVLQALRQKTNVAAEVCNSLKTRLLSLSQIYNDLVVPFHLTELATEIRKLSNADFSDSGNSGMA